MTISADTVIVGGGIAGVSLAHYLIERGATGVLVLEGDTLASGCTGGSLGGVRQQFSTPLEVELGLRGREFWRTFENVFGRPCGWHQDGYLMMTGDDALAGKLAAAADVQRACGATEVEILDPAQMRDLVPWLHTDGLVVGCWTPLDGRVNPTDGVYGLAAAVKRGGGAIREHFPVASIERAPGGWTVTGPETVTARRVVVAAGLGSPALMRPFGLDLRMSPMVVHYGFTTTVLGGQRVPMTVDLDTGFCVEREGDGAVVTVLHDEMPAGWGRDEVLLEFAELAEVRAPVLTDVGIHSTISAAADIVPDGHGYIGEVEDGLWSMTGFDGHGTMQGPAVGALVAGLLEGVEDPAIDMSVFDPRREIGATTEWMRASKKTPEKALS